MSTVHCRETRLGRWAPATFYTLIVLSWLIEGVLAGAGERLWLVLWSIPALGVYLWRTHQRLP